MAPLNAAFAFPEMNRMAIFVTEHLDFDVARSSDAGFDVYIADSKCLLRFGLTAVVSRFDLILAHHRAHAAAATAGHGFNHHTLAGIETAEKIHSLFKRCRGVSTVQHGNVKLYGQCPCLYFIPKQRQCLAGRPDKFNPGCMTAVRKTSIFTQKTIAWMNPIAPLLLCDGEDLRLVQIRGNTLVPG